MRDGLQSALSQLRYPCIALDVVEPDPDGSIQGASRRNTGSHSAYVIKVEHEPDSDHRRDRTAHNVSAPSICDEHQIKDHRIVGDIQRTRA
jgi:hypothetical protein